MASILPLALSLTGSRPSRRPAEYERVFEITDSTTRQSGLKAELTSALLGDALLRAADLGHDWRHNPTRDVESIFTGTDYGALFIAELSARFDARPGESLEQHIGVLPRWAIRRFDDGISESFRAGRGEVASLHEIADRSLVFRLPSGDNTHAVVLRRGAMVMGLLYIAPAGVPYDAARATALAALADQKWVEVAAVFS